jgi:uncharacterized protein (DUF4213/DUF364 family)
LVAPTWIAVADDAVKVGLGALIGGGIGIIATYLSQRRESTKHYNDKKREQLLDVALQFDKFYAALGIYWANIRNAAFKKESEANLGKKDLLSKKEKAAIAKAEAVFFESFPILSQCNTKLLLIGDKESSKKLSSFRETADQFFKESHVDNEKSTQMNLDNYQKKLAAQKISFLDSLHERYKSDK